MLEKITIDGVEYVPASSVKAKTISLDGNPYCIIRTYSAGCFAGYVEKKEGKGEIMFCYREEYGTDIDGNRGVIQTVNEVEDYDSDEIASQITDYLIEGGDVKDTYEVTLICPRTEEEIEIEVELSDYIDLVIKFVEEEDYEYQEDLLKELKEAKE